ncbi:MAG: ADP-ribosylglycohydrolase family protein, partial [Clostridium sp.]|nr:ADP-ribosylglycohydrolase family protein [Clostridium sp.]
MKNLYDGIIGLAIGDALGVPVEFQSRSEIAKNLVVSMREYGTHNQPMGTWSDDTSLTLATVDSIV